MRRRDSISLICAAIGLGFTVLAVGGALRWTAAVSAILVGVALVPFVLSRRGLIGTSPLVVALGAAAALTAVQLIPLPAGLIEALDPSGSALRDDGARIAGVAPWQALTLDAPGTLRALAFFLTLLGVAVLAIRFASSERGRLTCLGAVAAVCGATALIVGIHRIFGATSLYGVYVPNQATPPVLGPLLNPNHLGGLMALGAVVSTGLVIYARQSMAARAIWALSALGCLGVASLTLSRGAILGLATGLGVTLGIVVAQRLAPSEQTRSSRRRFLINTLPIGTVAVCVLVVIVYTSAGSAAEQLANTSLQEIREPKSKYAAWRSSVALIEESPWVGVGRGALEPAFTRVHPASAFVTFSHLENEYIQAVVEWGVPGALLLAALLGWLAIVAIRKWRDGPLAAAALGGVTTAIVQSNVDFGIELLGLAVPVTIVAATLATVPVKPLSPRVLLRARLIRLAHLGGLAAAALVLLLPITRSVAEDQRALAAHPPLKQIRASIQRHPLDYYGYAVASETLVATRSGEAIALLNHALVLHPTHSGLHRFAGRILLLAGKVDQAALEYVAAMRGTREPKALLAEVAQRFPADKAATAIPLDYENIELVVRTLEEEKKTDVALAWITRVIGERPKSLLAIELMRTLATQRGDWAAAERAASWKLQLAPSLAARLALAQLVARRGAHREVVKLLEDVSKLRGSPADQRTGWLLLCDSLFELRELDETTRCLRRLDGAGLMTPRDRAQIQRRLDAVKDTQRTDGLIEEWRAQGANVDVLEKLKVEKPEVEPATNGAGSGAGAGSGSAAP